MPKCGCFDHPQGFDRYEIREVGVDFRYGEVEVWTCKQCKQPWLRYLYEQEAFSKSGRWFMGPIPDVLAGTLEGARAIDILTGLQWYFRGGSFYDGAVTKNKGAPFPEWNLPRE